MATSTHYFSGKCRWAKLFKPDDKYAKYNIDVQLDEAQQKLYKTFKLKGPIKEDGFVTFRRKDTDGKPDVVGPEGQPITDLVGNDSEVTCKVSIYDYDNKFGKGQGARLEAVMVDKLVKYEKPEEGSKPSAEAKVENSAPPVSVPESTPARKRIPF